MKKPTLTPRLKQIADIVPSESIIADIGTDHAYLPAYLVMSGICQRAIASDINEGPVKRAKCTACRYGIENLIDIRLGAGLTSLKPYDADTVVIAGMGGLLIAEIIENSPDILNSVSTLILQPMTATAELRQYLYKNNYIISDEFLAEEENKIYNILLIKHGNEKALSEAELYIGKRLIEKKGDLYFKYYNKKIDKLTKIVKGLECSQSESCKVRLVAAKRLLKEVINIEA